MSPVYLDELMEMNDTFCSDCGQLVWDLLFLVSVSSNIDWSVGSLAKLLFLAISSLSSYYL